MAGVPSHFHTHVDHDQLQSDVLPLSWPPRDEPRRVQGESFNGCVRMGCRLPVELDDFLPGLLGRGPHVGVDFSLLVRPWQWHIDGRSNTSPK